MRIVSTGIAAAALLLLLTAGTALAESKVTVSNVHLCCGACVKAVGKALGGVDGVSGKCDPKAGTVTITASSDEAAQKAVNALQKAGFYGKSDNDNVKFATVKAPEGKVKRLQLAGLHNCCGACNKAIQAALKGVDGVAANTAKPKESSFVVEGDFSAAAVIDALLDKGFAVTVKK
jgi:copper chaperone CopZ